MLTRARALRHLAAATVVAGLLASLAASGVSAAGWPVRLEAGPHTAVTFDTEWKVIATRKTTLAAPATVTGDARKWVAGLGTHVRVASGALAGWWVRESRTAYVSGWVGWVTYAPTRSAPLAAGRYELYRFDDSGAMTAAKARTVAAATTTMVNASARINGQAYVRIADGTWAGWWIPGSTTSTSRITCSAGRPPAGTAARIGSSAPTATGEIALTFDMGGRLTDAVAILRYLELQRVCATIFPTGARADTSIGRQVMAEVRAHPELFELGNHTVHHCNLRDGGGGSACPGAGTRPSAAFVTGELQDADAIVASLAGRHTTPYWRPPYGAVDATLAGVAATAGYPYTMMWSTDTIDWRPIADGGPTAAQMAAKVVAGRKAGAIVLMHLGGYETRNALPAMLTGLASAGYTPTSISALYRAGH